MNRIILLIWTCLTLYTSLMEAGAIHEKQGKEIMKYNIENAHKKGLAKKLFDNKFVVDCVAGKNNTAYLVTIENKNFEDGAAYSIVSYSFGEPKYDEPWAGGEPWKGLQDLKATMLVKKGIRCLISASATGHIGTAGGCPDQDDFYIHKESIIHGIGLVGEHVYIVGPSRAIYRRTGVKKWDLFNQGTQDDIMKKNIKKGNRSAFSYAFLSIDGFSENDMYAVGNKGEAWHYDGKEWRKIDLPTHADLHKVHCAKDGYVYIAGDEYTILKGKGNHWEYIVNAKMKHPFNESLLESIAWFQDALYVGTAEGLYRYKNAKFTKIPLTPEDLLDDKKMFDVKGAKNIGFDSELLDKMALINGISHDTPNESISCLDTNFGYLLAGRTQGGLYRYDGDTWEIVAVTEK